MDPAFAPRIFLPYDRLLTNGRVLRDRAVQVSADRVVLGSGDEIRPDFVVLATGSSYPFPAKSDVDDAAAATAKYRALNAELAAAESVLLLGAGPVGIELAGEITSAWPDKRVILADIAEDILAGPYMPELRAELRRQLAERNVELVLGAADPAAELEADVVLRTHGVTPETGYLAEDLAAARDADGLLTVTPELRLAGHANVFAIGDVTAGHVKKGATAMRHAPVAAGNIRALDHRRGRARNLRPLPARDRGAAGTGRRLRPAPGTEEIASREAVSEIKGRHLMVEPSRRRPGVGDGEGDLRAGEVGVRAATRPLCALSTDDIEADQ